MTIRRAKLASDVLGAPAVPEGLAQFSTLVVRWQRQHGRHDLPWQLTQNPYHVWLSEVMLQQTQVVTVRQFYPRFLARFPTVASLAQAPLDDVLALWSGMGYYSRARHLHRAAQQIMETFGGQFPVSAEQWEQLAGVGRSTAAAISAFCFGQRVAILDGNVKRVLARVLAFEGDLAKSAEVARLWRMAEALLPVDNLKTNMPAYTQGLMDMGFLLCHARKPNCASCPVARLCLAHRNQAHEAYPVKSKKLRRTSQSIWLLHAKTLQGAVFLQRYPLGGASKVWAGLYGLPMFDSEEALQAAVPCHLQLRLTVSAAFKHVLTHKDLWLHVVQLNVPQSDALTLPAGRWVAQNEQLTLGLPAPIRRILEEG